MITKSIACFSLFYVLFGTGCSKNSEPESEPKTPVGDTWRMLEYQCASEIYGAWHTSDNSFFTSGVNSVCVLQGNQMKEIYHDSGMSFKEIWGDTEDNVWAVGNKNGGRIMRCTRDICHFCSETENMAFYAIHGTTSGLKYISGTHSIDGVPWGLIATTQDGESIEIVYEKEGYWMRDVWCDPRNEQVVGVGGSLGGLTGRGIVVTRGTDGVWKEQTVDTDNFQYVSVWGTGPDEIFIVGVLVRPLEWVDETTETLSVVYRWDGDKFTEVLKSDNAFFMSIWGKSSSEIYIGGQKWTRTRGDGMKFDAKDHIIRWNQTETFQSVLPAATIDNSGVNGFDCSIDGSTVYAYATEGDIYQRQITE